MAAKDPYPFLEEMEQAMARQVLADPLLLPKLAPFITAGRVKNEHARLIVEESLAYLKEYGTVPTLLEVLQGVRGRVETGAFKLSKVTEVAAYFEASHDRPLITSKYVMDRVFEEERKSAMWDALDNGLRMYRQGDLDRIVTDISKANAIGKADISLGIDVLTTLAGRTDLRKSGKTPPRWGTGIAGLDHVLEGGLAGGELGCILGGPKSGKSMFLDHIGVYTAALGGTSVIISLENGEQATADRIDAAISGVPINQLKHNIEIVHGKVSRWFADKAGTILVKYMPPKTTTTREIQSYLQYLRAEKSVQPTVLVVDYGDLMGSATGDYDKRHEELGAVYTELRSMAHDHNFPCWTASQANREALSQKVVKAENIGESLKKVQICDVLVAICRTEDERLAKQLRLFVALCRYATDGDIIGPLVSGYEMGRFVASGEEIQADED